LLPLLFVSVSRRRPASPLFPYTTLFRSGAGPTRRARAVLQPAAHPGGTHRPVHLAPVLHGALGRPHLRDGGRRSGRARHPRGAEDRKSIRLNSSHVSISYAVFCLKKKRR